MAVASVAKTVVVSKPVKGLVLAKAGEKAFVPLAKDTAIVKYFMRRFASKQVARRVGKKALKVTLVDPFIEGVAVSVYDRRNFKEARRFTSLRGDAPAVARGGLFPTTSEATEAYTSALRGLRDNEDGAFPVIQKSRKFILRSARGGVTPFVPIVGSAVRKNVALGLGVPRWVIFTAGVVQAL